MNWFQRLVLVVPALAVIQTAGVSAIAQQTSAIAATATPATVTILVFAASGDTLSQGSGFIVRSDGVIVTNWHVLAGLRKRQSCCRREKNTTALRSSTVTP